MAVMRMRSGRSAMPIVSVFMFWVSALALV